jgi:L-threonylcarbamoyladenylate synthase
MSSARLYAEKVKTLRLTVPPSGLDSGPALEAVQRAAAILRAGGTVAFPTETVYGLGANALDDQAVAKIFAAKQRPSWDPLIVHISDAEMLQRVAAEVPPAAQRLAERFWPGPLTLLLRKKDLVPDAVTAGRPKVGVRMPQHPVARALVRAAAVPIAAPSANRFGRTSPTCAAHVLEDLDGRIDAILNAGETWHGLESTVLDACETPCVLYRPGIISLDQIRAAGVEAIAFQEPAKLHEVPPESLPSPGVGLRHYAPRATLVLIEGQGETQALALEQALRQATAEGLKAGLMLPDDFAPHMATLDAVVFAWGCWQRPEELARRLFAGLRFLDHAGAEVILCPVPAAEGIGIAIRDRLRKAASGK